MASKRLLKAVTSPNRIASILDRNMGPVMALEIQRNRIGMAIAWSPDTDEDVEVLPDIRIRKRRLTQSCLEEFNTHVQENGIQGFVVNWPLVEGSGGLGAHCGRVLFTLESIIADQEKQPCHSRIFSSKRPLCLWEPSISTETGVKGLVDREDEWGRCALYGRTSSKRLHLASLEQYDFDETREADQIWDDFWRAHWPEQYKRNERRRNSEPANSTCNLISDWKDTPAYLAAGLAV